MIAKLRRRPVAVIVALVAAFVLWLAFRPELLFVNKSVDDPFPAVKAKATSWVTAPERTAYLRGESVRVIVRA